MKKTSIIYYMIALALLLYWMSQSLPFLKNLMPGLKLVYVGLPILFLLLTHFSPIEILKAFRLAGRKSQGTRTEFRNAFLFFKTAQFLFITFMLIGMVVLFIWFLASGPDSRHIAHPVSIMVGAFFFPLMFILFICLPFKNALGKKINEIQVEREEKYEE